MNNKVEDIEKDIPKVFEFSNKELSNRYTFQSGKRNTKKPSKLKAGGMINK